MRYKTFEEFYPFYLTEHANLTCRRLHVFGTGCAILLMASIVATQNWELLKWLPLVGYGFSWFGHFVFEKNKPASWKQPIYSLMGDFRMAWEVVTGKIPG